MASSEMLRRAALVRTDVSEKLKTSFIRVTRIGEVGTTLTVTSNRRTLRRNTEDAILQSHRHENLKSSIISFPQLKPGAQCKSESRAFDPLQTEREIQCHNVTMLREFPLELDRHDRDTVYVSPAFLQFGDTNSVVVLDARENREGKQFFHNLLKSITLNSLVFYIESIEQRQ
jgi:hypothetical protein